MHELGLAEGILGVVLDAAHERTVDRVRLRVGTLQRVMPDSLQFSFDLVAQDTCAEGGVLEITTMPARIRCRACGTTSELESQPFVCTRCLSSAVDVLSGDEISVEQVRFRDGTVASAPSPGVAESGPAHEHVPWWQENWTPQS